MEATGNSGTVRSVPRTLVMDHVSPATRLLEKRRQMFEVQEALELQKEEFNKKEENFRKREEALKKKDLELQESLIRFSRFLQENDAKRARAEKKAADEIKVRGQKEKEIEALAEALEGLKGEKETMAEVLEHSLVYQRYLEAILEIAPEYQEIPDLLTRHATLAATNHDLKEHQQRCSELSEKTRAELQLYMKQKTDEILNLNNQVAKLKKDLEHHRQAALAQESKKDYSLQVAGQRTLEYGQVVLSTDNLFARSRSRSHIKHQGESNPLGQLEMIGNYIADLGAIIKTYKAEQSQRRAE